MKMMALLVLIPLISLAQHNEDFEKYFIDKTMRIDYYHMGDSRTEQITLDQIYQYGIWAGSRKNLLDNFNNGQYYAKIYDLQSGHLIFSKGYDTIFGEYQASEKAISGIKRTYHESILLPYPRNSIRFTLDRRDSLNVLHTFFSDTINPQRIDIIRHEFTDPSVQVYKVKISGNPHRKIDIVILSEGYISGELDKFKSDSDKMAKIFFNQEPFKSRESDFNIYAVFKPSADSGIDEPRAGIFKQTALSASFNSLESERYVLTEDNKAMRDLASHVPYDAIYIMINHKRYGGGGIYNLFCTFTVDNQWCEYLFIHEFGHSFAGLADEYYGSPVAYSDFYPQGIEPTAPNITALLDPDNVKWKALVSEDVPIPTPWNKKEYDQLNFSWQELRKKLNQITRDLKRRAASAEAITAAENNYDKHNKEAAEKMDAVIAEDPNRDKVGAFEGAGYASTGLYRSMADCIMFSVGHKPFCKVCTESIHGIIDHYLE